MSKIDRFTGNMFPFAFGSAAAKRRVFGSTITESDTLDANMNADFNLGWQIVDPTAGAKPPQQWFNSSMYTATAMATYLYQQGIAEWDVAQEFFIGSITKGSDKKLYVALTDNVGQDPLSSPVDWETTAKNDFSDNLLASSGYQVMPGGLILQWGTMVAAGANGALGTLATLPLAFPTSFLRAVSSDRLGGANSTAVETASLTQIRAWGKLASNGNYVDTDITYVAIGH